MGVYAKPCSKWPISQIFDQFLWNYTYQVSYYVYRPSVYLHVKVEKMVKFSFIYGQAIVHIYPPISTYLVHHITASAPSNPAQLQCKFSSQN